ncbi:hypothetical protein [Kitasatospora sp. NPDC059599]
MRAPTTAPALEQVVSRLSSEPGVRDLHWYLDEEPDEEPDDPGGPALA